MSLPLYQIADQYRDILSSVDQIASDEDNPEVLKQLLQDTLDSLNLDQQFADKALAVACYAREVEAEAQAVKQTEDSLRLRRKRLEMRSEWLRDYLLTQMQKANKAELKNAQILVKLRKTPPRIVVDKESDIPEEFKEFETVTHIRKNWMLEKLKSGDVDSIAGVHLETGVTLTLR